MFGALMAPISFAAASLVCLAYCRYHSDFMVVSMAILAAVNAAAFGFILGWFAWRV